MGILADWQVKRDVKIEPFSEAEKRPGVISFGLTSYGYDCRLGYKFQVFSPIHATEVDPKDFDRKAMVEADLTPYEHEFMRNGFCRWCHHTSFPGPDQISKPECPVRNVMRPNFLRVPPHSFVLGESLETFTIPRDVLCVVVGKSTYARCGLIVNVTPLEPEWTGKVTIEISNTTPLPARIYAGEGIMQCLFFRSDQRSCAVSYADKKGRYQGQAGLTPPTVDE